MTGPQSAVNAAQSATGSLAGRTAVVTGATRGIGRAIAARMLAAGARVLGTGRAAGGSVPDGCHFRSVDLTHEAATLGFVEELQTLAPDILVNNAGLNRLAPFAETTTQSFQLLHSINVLAPMMLCRAVVPGMRARKWGRIVNVASVWSLRSLTGRAAYSASKFGLDGLTAALAAEVAVDNVLANCVSPGFVGTEMLKSAIGEAGIREMVAHVPMGRLGTPEEIAAFVAWLAGPENTFISGQNIAIDGGYTRT
ncbi:MAG TPA: SDR family oxidoreductase [Candidatus Sulfotelmatobacter sp.]|nr:SDR family oxidoreductase [Candidatus Sulfotelmatobacter sp.]